MGKWSMMEGRKQKGEAAVFAMLVGESINLSVYGGGGGVMKLIP